MWGGVPNGAGVSNRAQLNVLSWQPWSVEGIDSSEYGGVNAQCLKLGGQKLVVLWPGALAGGLGDSWLALSLNRGKIANSTSTLYIRIVVRIPPV